MKLISYQFLNLSVNFFTVQKTYELIAIKYFWLIFYYNTKNYIQTYNVHLAFKTINCNFYINFQFLLDPVYRQKNFKINFVIYFQESINQKNKFYTLIIIIVNRLIKILYYKSIKFKIDAKVLVEVIFKIIIQHYSISDSICIS